jgi:uncharacterized protein with FMN-binding domain
VRRRAPIVLLGTAAGLAGILSYHTHSTSLVAGSQPASGGSGGSGGTSRSSGSSSAPPASSASPSPASSSGASSSAAPTTGPPPATSAPATRTVTGPTVQFGYGQLAVSVTLSGGRITDVSVPTLQVAEYTSQEIAQQAIPMLKRQVLSAQSANIQGVSGATYTSQAYDQSLQSALSKAKQG